MEDFGVLTQGLGMYVGFKVAFGKFGDVRKYGELDKVIQASKDTADLSFGQQVAGMFSVKIPDAIDATLIS